MKKDFLQSRRGDVLTVSLMSLLLIGLVGAGITSLISYLNKQAKIARVKTVMQETERAIVTLLLSPASYTETPAGSGNYSLRNGMFDRIRNRPMLGAECAVGALACGVELQNESMNMSSSLFQARLVYTGVDVKVKPYEMKLTIPSPGFLDAGNMCPQERPLFAGLAAGGTPICRAIVNCPVGQIATGFDPVTRHFRCISVPQFNCPAGAPLIGAQSATGLTRPAGTQFQCLGIFDAYQVWGGLQ